MFVEDEKSEEKYFHDWAHVKDLCTECKCKQFPHDDLYSHHGLSIDLYRYRRIDVKNFSDIRFTTGVKYINRRRELGFITEEEYRARKIFFEERREKDKLNITDEKILMYPQGQGYQFINDVLPLKKYKFEEGYFFGLANAENILRMRYGDYMKLPPIEERLSHYNSVVFFNQDNLQQGK